jgi:hypothetical protein
MSGTHAKHYAELAGPSVSTPSVTNLKGIPRPAASTG